MKANISRDIILQNAIKNFVLKVGEKSDIFQAQHKGIGGQSVVYKLDITNRKSVCLKIIKEGKTSIHLERESRFLQILHSRHFPRLIIDATNDGFIIEEWVEGIPFNCDSRLFLLQNLGVIIRDLSQILQALITVKPTILHRDIKPKNLLFKEGRVMVLDFGSAEHEGRRPLPVQPREFPKLGRGTHVFQPFEQLTEQSTQDRRVDVFAAASTIFTIMEGRPPYDNIQPGYQKAISYYKKKEKELARILRKYPRRFYVALFDALRVDPEKRSKDLWNVVDAFEKAI